MGNHANIISGIIPGKINEHEYDRYLHADVVHRKINNQK